MTSATLTKVTPEDIREAEIKRLGQRVEYYMRESEAMRVMARNAMQEMYALIKQRPQGPAA